LLYPATKLAATLSLSRTGDVALEDHLVVVAVGGLDRAAELELRLLGGDRDHAGRGVLAEQRRLRPRSTSIRSTSGRSVICAGGARAVDVVDEHADRRLDAGVVGAVAEAADEEVGVGAALPLADAERGTTVCRSRKSRICARSIVSAVVTLTATGVSCSVFSRLVAVTRMSLPVLASSSAE
jgi:hypothetical protein